MVKRKADISLDEWLAKGVGSSELKPSDGGEPHGEPVVEPCPTVTTFPLGGRTEPATRTTVEVTETIADVAGTPADMAGTGAHVAKLDEGSAEWFWLILEQSGYERW